MNVLIKFYFVQLFSKIRNVYRRPISAIFTTIGIFLFFGLFLMKLLIPTDIIPGVGELNFVATANSAALLAVTVNATMLSATLLQKKQALFAIEDAYYLFSQPFSKKQVLTYLVMVSLQQSLFLGLYTLFMVSMLMVMAPLGVFGLLYILIVSTITYLVLLLFVDYFYLLGMKYPKFKGAGKKIMFGMVLLAIAILGIITMQKGFDLQSGFQTFIQSNLFHFIPIFGWMKATIVGMLLQQPFVMMAGLVSLLALTIIAVHLLINFDGNFYEEALKDSEAFSAVMKQAKEGKQQLGKIHNATGSFKQGEWALFSKNILILMKTRQFFNIQNVMVCVIYLAMAFFTEMPFTGYSTMILFWVFISIQNFSLKDELTSPYLYLLPGSPYKKMIAILVPEMISPFIVTAVSYIGGGIILQASILEVLQSMMNAVSFIPVMIAGAVLSYRILKGGTNVVVENMLRVLISFLVLLPSITVLIIITIVTGSMESMMIAAPIILFVFNIILSVSIILLCAPMLNGREILD